MCLIKGAFVGDKNFDVIKMHGTTIKIKNKIKALNQLWLIHKMQFTSTSANRN